MNYRLFFQETNIEKNRREKRTESLRLLHLNPTRLVAIKYIFVEALKKIMLQVVNNTKKNCKLEPAFSNLLLEN